MTDSHKTNKPLNILLSNDDGYRAEGIQHLRGFLRDYGEVTVFAPDRNRSGASNSLTLDNPLRLVQHESDLYSVNGTPTDCVHLALTGVYESEPDLVVSGVNHGANMGDDVMYSGTVAAAMEGRHLGMPAIAISINSHQPKHLDTASRALALILDNMSASVAYNKTTVLNVNVPDTPWENINGIQVTRLGKRHKAEPVIQAEDPHGNRIYWIGPVSEEQDAGEGTDFYAIQNDFISVTPLHMDLSHYELMDGLHSWVKGLNAHPK